MDISQGLEGSGNRRSTEVSLYVETELARAAAQNGQEVLWLIYTVSS